MPERAIDLLREVYTYHIDDDGSDDELRQRLADCLSAGEPTQAELVKAVLRMVSTSYPQSAHDYRAHGDAMDQAEAVLKKIDPSYVTYRDTEDGS